MTNFFKILLDYIYKQKCYFCGKSAENKVFCSSCFNSISFLSNKAISKILEKKIYCVSFYQGNIKKLIKAVKYHNKKALALYQAKIMFDFWQKIEEKKDFYTIIPVPIHKKRLKQRKYNHMDLVGKYLCEMTGYELNTSFITRTKDTKPQYKLTKQEREENLKDAFSLNLKQKPTTPILLIDDISTTGSTFLEIIKELKKNNIEDITCFVTAIPDKNSLYID